MNDIPFVDAHVHFWDLAQLRYDWLAPPFGDGGPNGDVSAIAQTYLPADYRAETAAWTVAGVVHIDAGARPDEDLAETAWLDRLADAGGLPTAIVAFADLTAPCVDDALHQQAQSRRVRGIRQIVNWHAETRRTYTLQDMTLMPEWRRGFARLAVHGLSFDLQCYPGQVAGLVPVLSRHDDVPVFLNHMGMPVLTDADGLARWGEGMRQLAALPHVAIKISGMGFAWRDWTEDRVRPLIREAIELFGTDRVMFASDLPTDRLFGSVDRHLSAYHAIVADFSRAERCALFGGNANRLYRLDLDLETRP
jgi:predicted TIM-barrel fold metal-dependent hydrolase